MIIDKLNAMVASVSTRLPEIASPNSGDGLMTLFFRSRTERGKQCFSIDDFCASKQSIEYNLFPFSLSQKNRFAKNGKEDILIIPLERIKGHPHERTTTT
jgi:hypothetical protein